MCKNFPFSDTLFETLGIYNSDKYLSFEETALLSRIKHSEFGYKEKNLLIGMLQPHPNCRLTTSGILKKIESDSQSY